MNFFHSYIDVAAIAEASKTLRSGFVSEGAVVSEFERQLAEELGVNAPVTVNSGTAGLHLALSLIGIQPGDEVIVPAQTFIATAQVVLMCGAVPVFADISPLDGNISTHGIEQALSSRTRAVIPVHWGGYPCDMDAINDMSDAAGIAVIEDAAHALGATYRGRPIGCVSRFTAFSFQAIKHLTTGDGGALCCLSTDDEHQARSLRWFGIDRTESATDLLGERRYDLKHLGFKYHMNNITAAIGIGNLVTFQTRLARHRSIAHRYLAELPEFTGLRFLSYAQDRESTWWFFPLLIERREDFARAMRGRAIACSVVHRRIDTNTIYAPYRRHLPGQDEFDRLQVNLPVHVGLTDEDVNRVIQAVRAGW